MVGIGYTVLSQLVNIEAHFPFRFVVIHEWGAVLFYPGTIQTWKGKRSVKSILYAGELFSVRGIYWWQWHSLLQWDSSECICVNVYVRVHQLSQGKRSAK